MYRFFRSLFSFLRGVLSLLAPAAIFGLHLGVMLCFINRWDSLVMVTLIPIWAWAGVGMLLSLIFWFILKSRLLILTFAIWLATGVFCADETPGLFRALMAKLGQTTDFAADSAKRLRVVTINCGNGNEDAARAALEFEPDIVLLQEAPEDEAFDESFSQELFEGQGSHLRVNGMVVVARGTLSPVRLDGENRSMIVSLDADGFPPIDLINLHLQRAVPRKDFWNPEAWQIFTTIRRTHRQRLRRTTDAFPDRPGPELQLIGGDFGTPANDDIYRMLRSRGYRDSFRAVGVGWGNTYTSRQPLLRIDQIWTSESLRPIRSQSVSNPHSDHRAVVSDFQFSPPGGSSGSR